MENEPQIILFTDKQAAELESRTRIDVFSMNQEYIKEYYFSGIVSAAKPLVYKGGPCMDDDKKQMEMLAANKAIQREKTRVYTAAILFIGLALLIALSSCSFVYKIFKG